MTDNIKLYFRKKFQTIFHLLSLLKYILLDNILFEKLLFKKLRTLKVVGNNFDSKKKTILFFAARQDPSQVVLNTILKLSLDQRGYNTLLLGCDKAIIKSCNLGSAPEINKYQCIQCYKFANKTYTTT